MKAFSSLSGSIISATVISVPVTIALLIALTSSFLHAATPEARIKRAHELWTRGAAPRRGLPPAETVTGGTVTGDVRLHRQVRSQFLSQPRDVWVWLPPGYVADERSARRYPVLYMHDGNNVLDARTAFLGREWGADETAQRLITTGAVDPFIIVAVGNTPDRLDEYTWVSGTFSGHTGGGEGEHYARFLVEELKPLIDRTYRTRPGRDDTAVMGSSLGGLISLYLGLHYPEVFGRIGAVSPSIWWSNYALHRDIAGIGPDLHVWLDMGAHEGDPSEQGVNLQHARLLKGQLVARGYREGETLGYMEDADGSHDEPSWARRLPAIFTFLFGPARAR